MIVYITTRLPIQIYNIIFLSFQLCTSMYIKEDNYV